jgi:A/G-specific adenine glycosylase
VAAAAAVAAEAGIAGRTSVDLTVREALRPNGRGALSFWQCRHPDRRYPPAVLDPSHVATPLLAWFDLHGRTLPWRGTGDLYRIWVSELMLQQTRVETVLRHYPRFVERFPDVAALAAASEDDVLAAWSGLGYYRRARNLHAGARRIVEELDGVFPTLPDAVGALPGVGRYTLGAVLSAGLDLKLPILDGNVIRVLSRLFEVEGAVDRAIVRRRLWELASEVLPDARPGDFNQALMDLGATVCLPRGARCDACPLRPGCGARRHDRQSELPVAATRAKVSLELRAAVLLRRPDGRFLLVRRPPTGLLAGMWELPSATVAEGHDPAAVARQLAALPVCACGTVEHRFSHRHWTVHVFHAHAPLPHRAEEGPDDHRWVREGELEGLGFPTVSRKVLELATLEAAGSCERR